MEITALIVLAIGLSMDTFAISLSAGVVLNPFKTSYACKIASVLAIFQGAMPFIGWLLGREFAIYIENYDHWIAFLLLLFLGIKMVYEGVFQKKGESCFDPTKNATLVSLGIATSIDALAVGISLAFLRINILEAVSIITLVTFAASIAGIYIGKLFGTRWKRTSTIIGGIILISIGIKILIEHTCQ